MLTDPGEHAVDQLCSSDTARVIEMVINCLFKLSNASLQNIVIL